MVVAIYRFTTTIQITIPVNQAVLAEAVRQILAAADACMVNIGHFLSGQLYSCQSCSLQPQSVLNFAVVIAINRRYTVHAVAVYRRQTVEAEATRLTERIIKAVGTEVVAALAPANAPARAVASDRRFIACTIVFGIMVGEHAVQNDFVTLMTGVIDFSIKAVAITAAVVATGVISKYVVVPDGTTQHLHLYLRGARLAAGAKIALATTPGKSLILFIVISSGLSMI